MQEKKQNKQNMLDQLEQKVKPKAMIGLQTCMGISESELTPNTLPKNGLLEFILSSDNLNAAYKKVCSNKGSGGIDGMTTGELLPYLR